MKSLFRIILISILIVSSSEVSAQMNFRKGWIITLDNDTVPGYIKEYGINRSMKVCRFKETKESNPVDYSPDQILAYRIEGGNYYYAGDYFYKGELKRKFAEVLLDGDLKLSHFGKNQEMAYYLEMEEGNPVGLINKSLNVQRKSDYGYMAYSNTTEVDVPVYKDTLYSMFSDNKSVQTQIHNVEYKQKSLIGISKAYINETCEGGNCITYEKDFRRTRDRFGVYSGLQNTKVVPGENRLGYKFNISYPIGIFYNVPIPVINERFSVQFEATFRKLTSYAKLDESGLLEDSQSEDYMIGIPILVNYRILWNRLSPVLGLGTEFGLSTIGDVRKCWLVDLGADFKLTSGLSIFARVRHQRLKFEAKEYRNTLLLDENLSSYFTALHLGIKF